MDGTCGKLYIPILLPCFSSECLMTTSPAVSSSSSNFSMGPMLLLQPAGFDLPFCKNSGAQEPAVNSTDQADMCFLCKCTVREMRVWNVLFNCLPPSPQQLRRTEWMFSCSRIICAGTWRKEQYFKYFFSYRHIENMGSGHKPSQYKVLFKKREYWIQKVSNTKWHHYHLVKIIVHYKCKKANPFIYITPISHFVTLYSANLKWREYSKLRKSIRY